MKCKVTNEIEVQPGARRTKGFTLREKPIITRDDRGFQKIELESNTTTILQSSLYLVRSWCANVDIQLLMYENSPENVDAKDIAKVTDYIVGYISKGYERQIVEKGVMMDIIQNEEELSCDEKDVQRMARKILNQTIKIRIIAKQEAMCHLGGLNFFCVQNK